MWVTNNVLLLILKKCFKGNETQNKYLTKLRSLFNKLLFFQNFTWKLRWTFPFENYVKYLKIPVIINNINGTWIRILELHKSLLHRLHLSSLLDDSWITSQASIPDTFGIHSLVIIVRLSETLSLQLVRIFFNGRFYF